MNISNILYKILGGLFLFTMVTGMAGIGLSHDKGPTKNPYLVMLKKMHFFNSRDYSTRMSRDRAHDLMLLRERNNDNQRQSTDQLKDQRFTVALREDQRPPSILPPTIDVDARNKKIREQLDDLRYKNRDAQDHYRQLIDAQRFK